MDILNLQLDRGPELLVGSGPRRLPISYDHLGGLSALSDAVAIVLASVLTGAGYHLVAFDDAGDLGVYASFGAVIAALLLPLAKIRGAYELQKLSEPRHVTGALIGLWVGVLVFLLGVGFVLKVSHLFSRGAVLSLALAGPSLILFHRHLLSRLVNSAVAGRRLTPKCIALVTSRDLGEGELGRLQPRGYEILNVFRLDVDGDEATLRASAAQALACLRGSKAQEIHLSLDWSRWEAVKLLLEEFRATPLPVHLLPDTIAAEVMSHPQVSLTAGRAFELQRAPLDGWERFFKRGLDLAVAFAGLVAAAPLLLTVALAVRLDSPGPILFRQSRNGFNGRPFRIYKFRSMTVLEDGPVVTQATRQDSRVTRVGRFLRRSSLDELPQLFNVLKGDMSLVGPRPHAIAHDDQYTQLVAKYAFRHHVKPGITGWAQVHGLRGETPSVELMRRRVDLDLQYIANYSLILDLRILVRTVRELIRPQNAF
jgi:Undecaprenyl-phosphate glucose phosphotransferase